MKISQRLLTIGIFVHDKANVYDVGADHGLLEKYLIESKKVQSIIAVENKTGPYKILKNNLNDYNASILLCDGLDKLSKSSDTVVIAGMGGILICDILKSHVDKLEYISQIVVDAHRDTELVRRTICELGYKIEKEQLVLENDIFYSVISFIKGKESYSNDVYEFGLNISKDPLFSKYKENLLDRFETQIKKLNLAKNVDKKSVDEISKKIERLNRI